MENGSDLTGRFFTNFVERHQAPSTKYQELRTISRGLSTTDHTDRMKSEAKT